MTAPTPEQVAAVAGRRPGQTRIMVCADLTATHHCVEGHPHEHTWHITAWFGAPARADARLYLAALDMLLDPLQGSTLPIGADWNEDICERVSMLCNCVRVRVWRQADRLGAEWSA